MYLIRLLFSIIIALAVGKVLLNDGLVSRNGISIPQEILTW